MIPLFNDVQQQLHDLTLGTQAALPANASTTRRWEAAVSSGVPRLFLPREREEVGFGLVETCVVARAATLGGDEENVWGTFLALADGDDVDCEIAQRWCQTGKAIPYTPRNESARDDPRSLIRASARLLGLAERASHLSVERAQQRLIGGRPLLEHQATAHRLARSRLDLKRCAMSVWEAAWSHDKACNASHLSLTAWAETAAVAVDVARTLTQIFGAAGTSDPKIASTYARIHRDAAAFGPLVDLWTRAASSASCTMAVPHA